MPADRQSEHNRTQIKSHFYQCLHGTEFFGCMPLFPARPLTAHLPLHAPLTSLPPGIGLFSAILLYPVVSDYYHSCQSPPLLSSSIPAQTIPASLEPPEIISLCIPLLPHFSHLPHPDLHPSFLLLSLGFANRCVSSGMVTFFFK